MSLSWLFAVATFCVATCFTPGPNNTMLMASGLNFGFARTLPHLLGVSIGFSFMVLAVAFGVSGVFTLVPQLYAVLKVLSIAYLLYLAWRIATAVPKAGEDASARPLTFVEGAAFQWINPKAWIMAIGVSATYVIAELPVTSVFVIAAVFLAAGLCSSATWALGGTALRRLVTNPSTLRVVNVVLALLLVASLWPVVADLLVGN